MLTQREEEEGAEEKKVRLVLNHRGKKFSASFRAVVMLWEHQNVFVKVVYLSIYQPLALLQ